MGSKARLNKARKQIEGDRFVERMETLGNINKFLQSAEQEMTEDLGTYWNGIPTQAVRGTAVVAAAPEFPNYWAADLVGQRVEVVRVDMEHTTFGGGVAWLENEDGEGWRKVTEGHGGPAYPHKDLAIEDGSFIIHTNLEAE